MSDKLQQAIQATRAGDTKNAQFLLTQAIQEDPNNPQSWYLLSLLVNDKGKKQSYLTKVIELDPEHEKAHQQLVAISEITVPKPTTKESEPEPVAVPLFSGSDDLIAQDEGDTLPDWMADDLPPTDDQAVETVVEVETETSIEEPVPDWLEGSLDEDWDQEKEETAVVEIAPENTKAKEEEQPAKIKEEKITPPKEKKPTKKQEGMSEKQLNYLLISLVVVAIVIFFIMAYMIFTMM